jgi:hypothetical protein|tara:strand:- start:3624 stop:3998 length:375 start_codon:yes stop_codon:yes gene_type:complete
MVFVKGKFAKAISDRSGLAFRYNEMVKEWNGSLVHKSEFEEKHPQLEPVKHKADAQALKNPRIPTKLLPTDQISNGSVNSLMASLGVTNNDVKIVGTFTSANATPLITALTLSVNLGAENIIVS